MSKSNSNYPPNIPPNRPENYGPPPLHQQHLPQQQWPQPAHGSQQQPPQTQAQAQPQTQQPQQPQPVVVLPLMHHQVSPNPNSAAPVWNGQYHVPPPPPHQVVYHQPPNGYSYPQVIQQQEYPSYNGGQPFPAQHNIPANHEASGYILHQPNVGSSSHPPGMPDHIDQNTASRSNSSISSLNGSNINFGRNPLPPYAIATMNNTQAKRQKTLEAAAKKGFRNSRRRHRNSHLGCGTCKSRRIKCDEQLPECKNCVRARLRCAYLALDDTARDALKVAQQAHAARIESLNIQMNEQTNKLQLYYPYNTDGLPTRILTTNMNAFPPPNVQPLQINLQRDAIPPMPIQHQPLGVLNSPHFQNQPVPHNNHIDNNNNNLNHNTSRNHSHDENQNPSDRAHSGISNGYTSETRSSYDRGSASDSTDEPESSPRFAIDSNSYATLSALIKDHKDVSRDLDNLAKLDGEYVEIVLDPKCTINLNKSWPSFDKSKLSDFDSGFEKEYLYKSYDDYHTGLMREARNNIVLFKTFLSNGAGLLLQFSKNPEVRQLAKKQLERDFEISLRFLNKFRIQFTQNVEKIENFFENVSLCFSKFQIFQTALPTTIYSDNTIQDNVQLSNRFFDFVISYLDDEFLVFSDEEVKKKFAGNEFFERANLFNDYMHVFIVYYVQCIKAYHSSPYKTTFMGEFLKNYLEAKKVIYENLSDQDKKEADNLENFLVANVAYWDEVRDDPSKTNRLQVIFYTLKKFLAILPPKTYIHREDYTYEAAVLESYYTATTNALKAIYPDVRFFFVFSFNARDGTRSSNLADVYLKGDKLTPEQRKVLEYPARITEFFKQRTFLISQLLSEISRFPAKIILDESNKKILKNLINEEQVDTFEVDVPKSSYPHIDESSGFYNKSTNSIVIPSVTATTSSNNFSVSQKKRAEMLRKAIENELTKVDQELIDSFFKEKNREHQLQSETENQD